MTNAIIWQNHPVKILEVTHEEALTLPLRKIPPTKNEFLRLIDITDFDLTACGGTHVANTAEIGLLKIVKQERRGEKQRIEFCCGSRALADYRLKHQVTDPTFNAANNRDSKSAAGHRAPARRFEALTAPVKKAAGHTR